MESRKLNSIIGSIAVLFLLHFAASASLANKTTDSRKLGFSLELVHWDSVDSPLYDGNLTFASSMTIRLSQELLVNSFKTIDGRGAYVHIAGGACLTLQYVSNVIIHGLIIHHCVPTGDAEVRSSPTHSGYSTVADGDGISLYSARDVWIDHCSLWACADGLVDAIMGSTGITVSNSHFAHHNEAMLLGHSDAYLPDSGMQVTIAFNRFGPGLVQEGLRPRGQQRLHAVGEVRHRGQRRSDHQQPEGGDQDGRLEGGGGGRRRRGLEGVELEDVGPQDLNIRPVLTNVAGLYTVKVGIGTDPRIESHVLVERPGVDSKRAVQPLLRARRARLQADEIPLLPESPCYRSCLLAAKISSYWAVLHIRDRNRGSNARSDSTPGA